MNSGSAWACSHWKSLPCWTKTTAVLGCRVPAFLFPSCHEGDCRAFSLSETQGAQGRVFKMAGTSPHGPAALPWLPRSISKAETDQGQRETIKKNNSIFSLKQTPVWVTRKRKANTVGLAGSTSEGKNKEPEVMFDESDHEYEMKTVCFCKDYPVSGFFIMTVMLLVHPLRTGLISSLWHTAHTSAKQPQTSHHKFHWGVTLGRLTTAFLLVDLASVLALQDWCMPKLHLRAEAMKHSLQTGEEGWVWAGSHRKTPTHSTSHRTSGAEWHQPQERCHLSVPGSCAVTQHAASWQQWMNTRGRQKLCWFKVPGHWVSSSQLGVG